MLLLAWFRLVPRAACSLDCCRVRPAQSAGSEIGATSQVVAAL